MSTLKIYTTDTKVADLDLTASVLNSINEQPAFSDINGRITNVNQQVLTVNNQLTSMQGIVSQVQTDIQKCTEDVTKLKDDILTLRTDIDELSGKTIFHYINNVSFLKPVSEHALHLSVAVFSSSMMDDSSRWNATFDSAKADDAEFVEALLVNNAANNAETDKTETSLAGKTVYSSFGSHWVKPVNEGYVFGFGPECNNAPVTLRLYDWLKKKASDSVKDLTQFRAFGKDTKLYLRTEWYYTTQDTVGQLVYHKSDMYSQVVPTNAEQTADKSYFMEPTVAVQAMQATNVKAAAVADYKSGDEKFYTLKPNQVNVISAKLGRTGTSWKGFCLADYSAGNEYRAKFTTSATLTVDNDYDAGTQYVKIIADGAELDDFANCSDAWKFQAGKTYLISIQAGMIQTLAQK